MIERALTGLLVAAFAFAGGSCTTSSVHATVSPELRTLRTQGYRVAVMPFVVSAPEDGFLTAALVPVGQLLSLEAAAATPLRDQVGARLRRDLVKWLQHGDLELTDPWLTDTRLVHAGWTPAQMQDPAHAGEAARLLQVDGIVYGDVTEWNRSWYLVQSTVAVALRVELRHGDGRVLFADTRREQIGSGLTGGPTGYVSAVTEPIAGLGPAHLEGLMRGVARGVAMDFGADAADEGVPRNPIAPRLSVVTFLPRHAGPFRAGERLEVLAIGTPGCDVRFDLGRLHVGVPMSQVAVDDDARGARATYRGYYVVPPVARAVDLPVCCTIRLTARDRTSTTRAQWNGTVALTP